MPKSWFSLGGIVVSLISVISLHLNNIRQPLVSEFGTSINSVLPTLTRALLPKGTDDFTANDWRLPSYHEYTAERQAQLAAANVGPQDAETTQAVSPSEQIEFADLVGNYFLIQDSPFWITQLRPEALEAEGLKPILGHSIVTIGFQLQDQELIQRYANQQHLPQPDAPWQYFDPKVVQSLLGHRRVVTEDLAADTAELHGEPVDAIGTEPPRHRQEVAPGGGKYWTEDPNAAWW